MLNVRDISNIVYVVRLMVLLCSQSCYGQAIMNIIGYYNENKKKRTVIQ